MPEHLIDAAPDTPVTRSDRASGAVTTEADIIPDDLPVPDAAAGPALRGGDGRLHLRGDLMEGRRGPRGGAPSATFAQGRAITKAILGTDRAEAIPLDNGTPGLADVVVMAVVMAAGIRPEPRPAIDARLSVGR